MAKNAKQYSIPRGQDSAEVDLSPSNDGLVKQSRGLNRSHEDSDSEPQETRFVWALRLFLYLVIFSVLGGKFLTGSYLWEYNGKWIRLRTYFPPTQHLFTEGGLAKFDGTDPNKPIYLAVK